MDDTAGHLALSRARETEAQHLSTTLQQIEEWTASIIQREANIRKYQDGIEAERTGIKQAREERARLRRKRMVFKRAVFALELIDEAH